MIEPPQPASTSNDHFTIIVFGLVSILVVLIPLLFQLIRTAGKTKQAQQDIAAVKYQVQNDHKINLRDDTDHKHRENAIALGEIKTIVVNLAGSVNEIRDDVKELKDTSNLHTEQIEDIERTNGNLGKGPRH